MTTETYIEPPIRSLPPCTWCRRHEPAFYRDWDRGGLSGDGTKTPHRKRRQGLRRKDRARREVERSMAFA